MIRDIILTPPKDLSGGEQLGFSAKSVLISNPTPAWWFLPDQQLVISPYAIGIVAPLLGTEVARILYQAPAGITQPTGLSSGSASFRYTSDIYQPQQGLTSYALVPPYANADLLQVPTGVIGIDYYLKGFTPQLQLAGFLANNDSGQLAITLTLSASNSVFSWDTYKIYLRGVATNPVGSSFQWTCPISLPTRSKLNLAWSGANSFFVFALY